MNELELELELERPPRINSERPRWAASRAGAAGNSPRGEDGDDAWTAAAPSRSSAAERTYDPPTTLLCANASQHRGPCSGSASAPRWHRPHVPSGSHGSLRGYRRRVVFSAEASSRAFLFFKGGAAPPDVVCSSPNETSSSGSDSSSSDSSSSESIASRPCAAANARCCSAMRAMTRRCRSRFAARARSKSDISEPPAPGDGSPPRRANDSIRRRRPRANPNRGRSSRTRDRGRGRSPRAVARWPRAVARWPRAVARRRPVPAPGPASDPGRPRRGRRRGGRDDGRRSAHSATTTRARLVLASPAVPPRAASRVGEAGQRLLERDDRRRRAPPLPLLLRIPLLPTAGRPATAAQPARDGGASFTPEKVARDGVARFPLARIIVGRRLRRDADQGHGGDGGVLDVRLVLPPRRRADAVAAEREHRRVAREPVEPLERSRRARRRLHERPRRPRDAFARFRPLQKHLRRLLERLFGVRALVPVEEGVEVRPRLGPSASSRAGRATGSVGTPPAPRARRPRPPAPRRRSRGARRRGPTSCEDPSRARARARGDTSTRTTTERPTGGGRARATQASAPRRERTPTHRGACPAGGGTSDREARREAARTARESVRERRRKRTPQPTPKRRPPRRGPKRSGARRSDASRPRRPRLLRLLMPLPSPPLPVRFPTGRAGTPGACRSPPALSTRTGRARGPSARRRPGRGTRRARAGALRGRRRGRARPRTGSRTPAPGAEPRRRYAPRGAREPDPPKRSRARGVPRATRARRKSRGPRGNAKPRRTSPKPTSTSTFPPGVPLPHPAPPLHPLRTPPTRRRPRRARGRRRSGAGEARRRATAPAKTREARRRRGGRRARRDPGLVLVEIVDAFREPRGFRAPSPTSPLLHPRLSVLYPHLSLLLHPLAEATGLVPALPREFAVGPSLRGVDGGPRGAEQRRHDVPPRELRKRRHLERDGALRGRTRPVVFATISILLERIPRHPRFRVFDRGRRSDIRRVRARRGVGAGPLPPLLRRESVRGAHRARLGRRRRERLRRHRVRPRRALALDVVPGLPRQGVHALHAFQRGQHARERRAGGGVGLARTLRLP